MPLDLFAAAIVEKNKLASSQPHIILAQITLPSGTILRVCRNNENIAWNGYTWVAFPFDIDTLGEQKAEELPSVNLRVGNASQVMSYYLEQGDGGVGAEVLLMVVHASYLNVTTPILTLYYECISTSTTAEWATFNLGAPSVYRKKIPRDRLMKRYCRHKIFKGIYCKYAGAATTCNRTYEQCRTYGNLNNFGGAPGLGSGGLKI
jgi:phage-related protein